jgi:hypothetical protein
MHGDADPAVSRRLAEDVQWQLDPLHFLVTLDRLTGLGHGIDQRELDAFGVALRRIAVGRPQKLGVYKRAWGRFSWCLSSHLFDCRVSWVAGDQAETNLLCLVLIDVEFALPHTSTK